MADPSGSPHFQVLFVSALRTYQTKTGITLAEHALAVQLQNCNTVESITSLMQCQAQAFSNYRESDRIMKSIKTILSILTPLSAAAPFADTVGLSFPPAKAIQAGLAILLDVCAALQIICGYPCDIEVDQAAKGVTSSWDALLELLESIEHFINRLDIYRRIPRTPVMDEMVANIMVELLSTLALATSDLKQGRSIKSVKKAFGDKDVEAILQRLGRLTQNEARTTAAQILHVIYGLVQNMSAIMNDGDGKASIDDVRKVLEILHQMASDINKLQRDQLRRDIRSWLSPPDPWKNYNVALKSRQSKTGAWFINGNILSEWRESGPSSLLWIHGKPGAGKSVLCSTIIEEIETMRKSGLASLAMFYYDFREEEKKDLRGLLSSILFQLSCQSDSYYGILSTFYSTHLDGATRPSDSELVQCLKDVLNVPGQAPIFLIVDALDECPNTSTLSSPRGEVLTLLEDLIDLQLPHLRICVTSRPEVDIKPVLEPLSFRSVSLHDERGQKEDIENYIKSVVNTNRTMRRWKQEHRQVVIEVLTERADGMFRWVYCQLDYLGKCLPGRIRYALNELPATLDETYERTLQEIDNTNWEFSRRLLLCVAVVGRPLSVEQLATFLGFDFKSGQIPKFCQDWCLEDPVEAILSTCSTLLSVVNVEDSQVIQFSHFSVKEFLTSTRFAEKCDTISRRYHVSMTPAHTLVAKACLGILLHLDKDVTRDILAKFPLAEYAAEHWFVHARFEGVSEDIDEGMKKVFDPRQPHFAIWLWIYNPTLPSRKRSGSKSAKRPRLPRGTALHYSAFCGLHSVVKDLAIEDSEDVNSHSFYDESRPLHLASQAGHVEIARLLVERGADVGAQDKNGETPLHRASSRGHLVLARFLVEHGADAATQNKDGETSLHWASSGGHLDVVQFLVEHGSDAAAQNKYGETPLHWASSGGRLDLARFLVEHGADAAAKTKDGVTPLHSASSGGQLDLARLLVEHGADTAAQKEDGGTPLHLASSSGRLDLAQFLVERGVDVAARNKDGETPLHSASKGGHLDLARFLVEHGADVATQNKYGVTPLHSASEGGHLDLAQFLVEHGADAEASIS